MNKISFSKYILFALTVVLFASCDKDFNTIGTDIIGDDNFALEKYSPQVVAFNQNTGTVQTNNLTTNALGIYTNAAFGTTTANFATQVELASVNPTIDPTLHPAIESVILTIPYFSTKTGVKDDGETGTYELDSIYGSKESKLKLSIFESGYYMKNLDPATNDTQIYYSNQNNLFDSYKGQKLNNDADLTQNNEFVFSDQELKEVVKDANGTVTSTTRSAPGMKLNLDINFFKTKIIEAPSGKLTTNDVFKEYFRGLYFKVEKSGASPSNLALINFKGGKITINYKEDASVSDTKPENRVKKSIVLSLTGNSVNLFQNDYLPSYTNGIASPNSTLGDEKLYLKGGEGSMAVVQLFGNKDEKGYDKLTGAFVVGANGISDELEEIRHPEGIEKWLINDATLTFSIDNATLTDEPNRIYLYDLNNKRQLLDYTTDASTRTAQKYNKYIHDGIIQKGSDGKGVKYKIKLTNHIRNLILNDTVTNVRLGLVVTENINDVTNKKLATPVFSGNIKEIPTSSVMNPLGTILYGNTSNVPEEKKLKFEIYYTKPN